MFLVLLTMMANAMPVQGVAQDLLVTNLRTEYLIDPIGIDVEKPRLSWQLVSDSRDVMQSAYQVRVAAGSDDFERATIWDSGRIESSQSIHVPYEGPDVSSRKRYYWQVRVWREGDGDPSPWSSPSFWEMGLLERSDWKASWISTPPSENPDEPGPVPLFRRDFEIDGAIRSARLYVTSLGLYEMELNGSVVGDQVFTPGWTSYDTRLQYQTYDVTEMLHDGANAVGGWVGDGWYRGYLTWDLSRNVYGSRPALLAQLEVVYDDGRMDLVTTDGEWTWSTGPILMSDIYMGETYDARLTMDGWSTSGLDAAGWERVEEIDGPFDRLVAPAGPPVRRVETLTPVDIRPSAAGLIVDMGQNMVGRVRIVVDGPEGTTVRLRHAEVLDKEGELYRTNLRGAKQEDTFIARGNGPETFEARFTFHGFRYVEVAGYPSELTADKITGIVIHSDMPVTGHFQTSDPLINKLQQNIVWGQKGNFLDVPTDCPQRDERLGWTGDAQVFAPTAAFNMDVAAFFTKWLKDLAADQKPSGSVPWVIPNVISRASPDGGAGATGWGDAAVIVPWTLYLAYGDKRVIEDQYDSMRGWVDFMRERAGDDLVWAGDTHFGDWLAFAPAHPGYPGATTSTDLIATAYFAHSTDLLARMSAVIGRDAEARELRSLFEDIRSAFQQEFFTGSGRLVSETQTAYAMALAFDLVPPEFRDSAVERLAHDVERRGHLTTGFLGAPLLTSVLADNGHLDLAFALLMRKEYPSWLYPVTMGATTIWERWDSLKPDTMFQDPGMNSFNHYAYGAIGDWMYREIGGINLDPSEAGYRHVLIEPHAGGGIETASASLQTMYGRVATSWSTADGAFKLSVEVPPNTYASVVIPSTEIGPTSEEAVTEQGKPLESVDGIRAVLSDSAGLTIQIGSGRYEFEIARD